MPKDLVPLTILAHLCSDCIHGSDCVEPRISAVGSDGVTCYSYEPTPGEPMAAVHILALPDREPCAECACRKGTQANDTPHTMAQFKAAVDSLEPFLCHGSGHGRVCAGWLRAAKAQIGEGK